MRFYIKIPTYLVITVLIGFIGLFQTLNPPRPEAVYSNPETAEEFLRRGELYADRQEYEKALADYVRAEQLDPSDRHVYLKKGSALSALNQPKAAIEQYEQAKAMSEHGGDLVQYLIDQERQKLQ
ncbi:MAG: tetratricopeptide repeat protein [Cyanobacteria bacterium J06642_9]